MSRAFLPLMALIVSAGILLAGNGLQGTLISVRADLEAFSLASIGFLMSSYFLGFISGCLVAPGLVARAGHIRAFAAFAAIAAATALIYALEVHLALWIFLRAITGFCFAGLYMIIESWINEKTGNEYRGRVLAVYRVVDFTALTIGQYLLIAADPADFALFSLVAILISLAIVPVTMTRVEGPRPPTQTKLNLSKIWRVSPLSAAGAFAVGLANGAFWAIAPVFVLRLGYETGMVASFMSAAIIASALAQWPVGLLSDAIDRRLVLIGASGAAALAGAFLFFFAASSDAALLLGAVIFGAAAMCIFGLCAAYANDHAEASEFVAVSGGLLLIFGLGSIGGPLLAAVVMSATTPSALFAYTAVIHLALFGFGLYRMTRRAPVPAAQQEDFVAVPNSTPAVFEIDPRAPAEDGGGPAKP